MALDGVGVAAPLDVLQSLDLRALAGGVDAEGLLDVGVVLDVAVDADDDVLLGAVALAVAPGGLVDLADDEAERLDAAAELVDAVDERAGGVLDLVGQRLDEVAARERVDGVGRAGLVRDDLLGALSASLAARSEGSASASS